MSEILQFLHLKISSLRCLTHKALAIVSIQSISKKKKDRQMQNSDNNKPNQLQWNSGNTVVTHENKGIE